MYLDPESPVILLKVELESETQTRVADMALDTGATFTVISWAAARELGYDPGASPRKIQITTASSVEEAPIITLNKTRAMGVEALDVDVACFDLPGATGVEGLLGLSFLRHFDVDLHFRRQVLEARS